MNRGHLQEGVHCLDNSLCDSLGFVTPITMQGKALVWEQSPEQSERNVPLPPKNEAEWNLWKDPLKALDDLHIQRCYTSVSLGLSQRRELCMLPDGSTVAIWAVAYMRAANTEGKYHVRFVMGKLKLAPRPVHTIPSLELCAAVLAVELHELIRDEMDIEVDTVKFFFCLFFSPHTVRSRLVRYTTPKESFTCTFPTG